MFLLDVFTIIFSKSSPANEDVAIFSRTPQWTKTTADSTASWLANHYSVFWPSLLMMDDELVMGSSSSSSADSSPFLSKPRFCQKAQHKIAATYIRHIIEEMSCKIVLYPKDNDEHQWWQCEQVVLRPRSGDDTIMHDDNYYSSTIIQEIEVLSVYIAEDVAQHIIQIGRYHPVQKLTMRACEVWPDVMQEIFDNFPKLQDLTIHKVKRLDRKIMTRIARMPNLRRLSIHHKTTSPSSLSFLLQNLGHLHNLEEFRLDGSSLAEYDLNCLIHSLSSGNTPQKLQLLSFKSCLLSDESVARLVNAICRNKDCLRCLKTLDFSINHCYEHGMVALAELLISSHCQLEQLNLICQLPRTGTMLSVEPLSQALRLNTSLRSLRLSGNAIQERSMIHSLAYNRGLEYLDWCGNSLKEDGLRELGTALSFNRTLRSLNLKSNKFDSLDSLDVSQNDTMFHLGHNCRDTKAQEIAFWCRLNTAGRHFVRDNPNAQGLWPFVIEHCNLDLDAIHFFIRNTPVLWEGT